MLRQNGVKCVKNTKHAFRKNQIFCKHIFAYVNKCLTNPSAAATPKMLCNNVRGHRGRVVRPVFVGWLPVVQGHRSEKHDGCRKKFEVDKQPTVGLFGILERRYQFTKPF